MEVQVHLDRVTVSGEADSIDLVRAVKDAGWRLLSEDQGGKALAVLERWYDSDDDNKVGDIENLAVLLPNPYRPSGWRVDTSNHLTSDELRRVLSVCHVLGGAHLTRIDVCFDFINGNLPVMAHKIIRPRASQREIRETSIYSGSGRLLTVYSGARSSDVMYRLYDKLVEAKRHKIKIPDGCEKWERWEVQLRGSKSSDFLASAEKMLSCVKFPRSNVAGESIKPTDRAMLHALDDRVISFSDLSKSTRAKYRRLQRTGVAYSTEYADAALKVLEANSVRLDKEVRAFVEQLKS